jgi:hypothetical protein
MSNRELRGRTVSLLAFPERSAASQVDRPGSERRVAAAADYGSSTSEATATSTSTALAPAPATATATLSKQFDDEKHGRDRDQRNDRTSVSQKNGRFPIMITSNINDPYMYTSLLGQTQDGPSGPVHNNGPISGG